MPEVKHEHVFLAGIEMPPGGVLRKNFSVSIAEISVKICLIGFCELPDTVCQA